MKVVFTQIAKAPIEGQVKTRLTTFLSPQEACELHKKMVMHISALLCRFSPGEALEQVNCNFQLWGSQQHPFFDRLTKELTLEFILQRGEDLGARLTHIVGNVYDQSYDAVVLLGSDCPLIDENYLTRMLESLVEEGVDGVIGPAEDGGYVILALKRTSLVAQKFTDLFSGISWGSGEVLNQTLTAAKRAGIQLVKMPELSDIDRPEDLAKLNGVEWNVVDI